MRTIRGALVLVLVVFGLGASNAWALSIGTCATNPEGWCDPIIWVDAAHGATGGYWIVQNTSFSYLHYVVVGEVGANIFALQCANDNCGTTVGTLGAANWDWYITPAYTAPCATGTVLAGGVCVLQCSTNPAIPASSQSCIIQWNCIPSVRTVDPCPSGYAPASVTVSSADPGGAYSSAFEKLPIQDILYGLGVTVCGLLGIMVGTKLL